VREFALEQLEANGWADEARVEHARYFLRLAEEAAPGLRRPDQRASMERLTPENDNLRAALSYLLERSPEDGVRLTAALCYYWYSRSHYREGRDWVERALEVEGAASPARARLLQNSATFRLPLGDADGAAPRARDSLTLARALGDREMAARALNSLGVLATNGSRLAEARAHFEEGLAIARELDDRSLGGLFLGNLGDLARAESDYAKAARYYEESLEAEGPERFTTGAAVCLVNIGAVRFEEGDFEEAAACYREAVATARKLGNTDIVAMGLDGLAAIAVERGRSELAARLAGAAEAECESLGMRLQDLEGAFRARYVEKLKGLLDAAAFEREWARGRSMGLEAAVAEALESD
jgi:tetratricopeptide (TPR) repeat protein